MKNYNFTINGNKYSVEVGNIENNIANVTVNGTAYAVEMDNVVAPAQNTNKVVNPTRPAEPVVDRTVVAAPAAAASSSKGGSLKSPLPGTILDVFVNVGDTVKAGQRVILLEAMKMENNIDSECDGVVKEIKVKRTDSVMEGDVLIVFE
ncbi:MAG: acetyl-CoA carboxylase biotin carboxyl carrier protein subunit [Bacteroidales bacterium]|nr:acetyl-CoA carboxylase biotin carboxyl carrier protein subunit [Bacteroidales bacterium]